MKDNNEREISVPKIDGGRIAILNGRWHLDISAALVAGAQRAAGMAELAEVRTVEIPGSFELPLAAQYFLESGFDAVIVLGLILRGETPHFDYVCAGATQGIMQVMLKTGSPIGFGILMCDNLDQAIARAGLPGSSEDKGFEATVAALEMLHLKRSLLK